MRTRLSLLLVLLLAATSGAASVGVGIKRALAPQTLHILAVGIDTYDSFPLKGAAADARAIAAAFEGPSTGYKGVTTHLLIDGAATRAGMQKAFEEIAGSAKVDDTFLFLISGLAWANEAGDGFLVPVDADSKGLAAGKKEATQPLITGAQLKTWMDRVQARNQIAILDVFEGDRLFQTLMSGFRRDERSLGSLNDRSLALFANAGAGAERPGADGKIHGALTDAVLRGFEGAADMRKIKAPGEVSAITAGELAVFVQLRSLDETDTAQFRTERVGPDFWVHKGSEKAAPAAGTADPDRALKPQSPPSTPAPAAPPRADRHDYALLIATDEYEHFPKLANPVNDARTIATELREMYGFETRLVENPTEQEIKKVLREYAAREFGPDDQLLIFVAGHGEFDDVTQEGYLVARNSVPIAKGDNALTHSHLQRIASSIDAQHLLLVLDSCFSGTFDPRLASGRSRSDNYEISTSAMIKRKLDLTTKKWLTSGGKEYVSDGAPGRHSPFAWKLLEALRSYGGKSGILTTAYIQDAMQSLRTQPRYGDFPDSSPGAEFLFIANAGLRDAVKKR